LAGGVPNIRTGLLVWDRKKKRKGEDRSERPGKRSYVRGTAELLVVSLRKEKKKKLDVRVSGRGGAKTEKPIGGG